MATLSLHNRERVVQQSLKPAPPRNAPPPSPQAGEMLYPVAPEVRSGLRLDLRYILRDPARARALPLLCALSQTIDRELARIRFPAEALPRLAAEIDRVADGLPEHSPLLDLSERARAFARANAFDHAGTARTPDRTTDAPPENDGVRSASEEAQALRHAAAAVEVAFVTTSELDEQSLAGYLNYCMTLENYDAVITSLMPRTRKTPRVWSWNLLLVALRLSKHPDFTDAAARFHAWMEDAHPEAQNDLQDCVDVRRFSTQKMRILEQRELGIA